MADNFDNLKFQDARKVTLFRPPNHYILHCHSKGGLFTIYLKGNGMKNSKFGKSWILYMYTLGPQWKIVNYGLQEELMGAKCLHSGRNKWNSVNHLWFMRNDVLQNYYFNFCKCLADNFDNLKFQDARKVVILDHQIVTSCISMVNVVFILFIWKEMTWKIPNLENLEFYTCTLWDHNAKVLILAYRGNSWVPNDCILVGINETQWTTWYCMRNDVL